MSPGACLGATGFGLIAVCYGFARFAFGLFLPRIDAELSLSSDLAGAISGGSFLGYCIAIIAAAYLTERFGARAVAVGAAVIAATGMAGIAWAPSTAWLAASVLLAGLSTGLASPPMAAAVAAIVRHDRQDATNTFINAGTSAGVVLSGPVALMMGSQWRVGFAIFAAVAFAVALLAAFTVPKQTGPREKSVGGLPAFNGVLGRLILAAFLMGASSTSLWSFGSQLVSLQLGWRSAGASLLWVVIGTAGIAGAGAGMLTARLGIDLVHRVFLGALAAGILLVGTSSNMPALTLGGGALFGAAYIMLTGVYLVWGISAQPERPATGLTIGFLTIAMGQTVGAPLFGFLAGRLTMEGTVIAFALLTLPAGLLRAGSTRFKPC
ncbi:MFS transporter [Erwinia typographi]|uniref:MFS transporter n=1 Tax=Erwinia typographi TaxID=371042 RepID=A0A0A3YS98_9GAMM|nr:MFS transporter [Erwinia typographi]